MRAAAVAACLSLLAPSIAAAETESNDYSNPATATKLSLLWSTIGVGTMLLGSKMHDGNGDTPIMVLGGAVTLAMPSAGHWWADGGLRFTPGFGVRLLGMTVMGVGFGSALDRNCDGDVCNTGIHDNTSDGLVLAGAAIVLGGIVLDIATAGGEAEEHNARVAARRHRYGLAPTVIQTPRGTSPGVGIAGAF